MLKKFRNFLIGSYREDKLSKLLAELILINSNKRTIKILDYGSGFEPEIIRKVQRKIIGEGFNVKIDCYDLYNDEQLENLNKEKNINFHNIDKLGFADENYDYCIIADTLHHIGVDNLDYIRSLMKKIKLKSKYIIIKDHFEWNKFSRFCLRLMDFVGNYHNNVNIPKKYFTKQDFEKLLTDVNLKVFKKIIEERYHPKLFLFLSNPKFHFIYLVS